MEGVSGIQITCAILQSNPANTDTEGAIDTVHIKGISVFSKIQVVVYYQCCVLIG